MNASKSLPDNSVILLFHCWHLLFVFFIQFEICLMFGMSDLWFASVQFCTMFWDSRPYQNILFYLDFFNNQVGIVGGGGTASLLPRGPEVHVLYWTLADTLEGGSFLVSARQAWEVELPLLPLYHWAWWTSWLNNRPPLTPPKLWGASLLPGPGENPVSLVRLLRYHPQRVPHCSLTTHSALLVWMGLGPSDFCALWLEEGGYSLGKLPLSWFFG